MRYRDAFLMVLIDRGLVPEEARLRADPDWVDDRVIEALVGNAPKAIHACRGDHGPCAKDGTMTCALCDDNGPPQSIRFCAGCKRPRAVFN